MTAGAATAQSGLGRLSLELGFVESAYFGDRAGIDVSGADRLGAGWDVGLAYAFSSRWDAAARFRSATYPGIISNSADHETLSASDSEEARSEIRFELRRSLFRMLGMQTYAMLGYGSISGDLKGQNSTGSGPAAGLGAWFNLGPLRVIGGVEGTSVLPNRALDRAGENGGSDPVAAGFLRLAWSPSGFGRTPREPKEPRLDRPRRSRSSELPPLSVYAFIPAGATVGEEVTMSAQVPESNEVTSVLWDLGDGTQTEGMIVTHRYTQAGHYPVRVQWVTDERLMTMESAIQVDPRKAPAEVMGILSSPARPMAGQEITFTPQIRGNDVSCFWTFGDGSEAEACETSHRFEEAGSYDVQLIVSNADGSDMRVKPLEIAEDPCRLIESLRPVYFARGSSRLSLEMREALRENFSDSAGCAERVLEIRGYAFNNESNAEDLAKARAESIMQYYLNLGMRSSAVEVTAYSVINLGTYPNAVWTGRRGESTLRLR